MKAFSLEGEVQNLINELNSINLSNAFNVLEWFYKAIDFNSMFEDKNISSYIYATLTNAGYQTMLDPKSDLDSFKKLMNGGKSANEIEIANALIRQALYAIKNSQSLNQTLLCQIQAFNEKYNKKFAYSYMMENLKEAIGERIIYTGMKNGEYFIKTGILTYVSDFKFFTVNNEEIEFFDDSMPILTIQSQSGSLLFNNNIAPEEPQQEKNMMQFS